MANSPQEQFRVFANSGQVPFVPVAPALGEIANSLGQVVDSETKVFVQRLLRR